MYLKYIVKDSDINKTINQILNEQFSLSNRLYSYLINNKKILLNKKIVDTRTFAKLKDELCIDLNYCENNSNIIATQIKLNILYEDQWLLILNKPAGIPVHPSIAHYNNSLSNGVKFYFDSINLHKKIRPVNRLDLNTSGIIVFAKNEYIQECLIQQMAKNIFYKEYIAIVEGLFSQKSGFIDAPIVRKDNSIIERCVPPSSSWQSIPLSQKAFTEYKVLGTKSILFDNNKQNYSIVKCRLITGKTHQIRVHMSYIGHPLLGDTLYNKYTTSLINRQALHSYKIGFVHPISHKATHFECPLPADMKKIIE